MREEILPLLPKFFANRRGDVRIIRDAVDRNDLAAVATLAHNMRGTGASYGFPEISALGDALQAAGKRGAVAEIQRLSSELEHLLDRLEGQYAEMGATAASQQHKKAAAAASAQRGRVQSTATERASGDKH
jgi:HPt (histidine-containing phosphotransfer) domain-containing protein